MSEFQCYQFRAMERDLTEREQYEVKNWSSRAVVGRNSATFVYNYGDFKKKPAWAVEHYFDIMVYFSNFGIQQIILKFPLDAIDVRAVSDYILELKLGSTYKITLEKRENCYLLDLYYSEEEGSTDRWLEEDTYDIKGLSRIHEAIMDGDYRALYLLWSYFASFMDEDYHEKMKVERPLPPPIPPNLKKADKGLDALVDFFEIPEEVVSEAKKNSPNEEVATTNYEKILREMPAEEQITWLLRLLDGEKGLQKTLQKHLKKVSI